MKKIAVLSVPLLIVLVSSIHSEGNDYFFGQDERNESLDTLETPFERSSSGITEQHRPETGDWEDRDTLPAFPELSILDDVSSERSLQKFQRAQNFYNLSLREMDAGRRESQEKLTESAPPNVRYEWEREEHRQRLSRESSRILSRHRLASLGYVIRAMTELEDIRNPQVSSSPEMMEARARIYRMYVKLQFQSRNLANCVEILKKYIALGEERARESEPHRLLAACYRQQEIASRRMNNRQAYLEYRRLKNEELMLFARLQFGEDSAEFRAIQKQVDRDMMVEE